MSTITLNNITSGYNVNKINDNFTTITNSVNNDVVHSNGGQNVMGQDLDLNSKNLLNVGTVNAGTVKINGLPITTSQFVLGNNVVGDTNISLSGISSSKVNFLQSGTGSVVRTIQSKNQDFVSVLDKGADPTGLIDSTTAFINALAVGKKTFVPAGTYLINVVALPPGAYIYGEGAASILLQTGTTPNGQGILFCNSGSSAAQVSNIVIRDLTLQGNVASLGFSQFVHLLSLNGVKDALIENVHLLGFQGDGIYLGSGDVAHQERHNTNVIIRNCVIDGLTNNNRNGLSIVDGDDIEVHDNVFRNCASNTMPGSIDLEPDPFSVAFCVLKNIAIHDNLIDHSGGNYGAISINLPDTTTWTNAPGNIRIHHNTIRNYVGLLAAGVFFVRNVSSTDITDTVPYLDIHYYCNNSYLTTGRHLQLLGTRGVSMRDNTFTGGTNNDIIGFSTVGQNTKDIVFRGNRRSKTGALLVYNTSRLTIDGNRWADILAGQPALNFNSGMSSDNVTITNNDAFTFDGSLTIFIASAGHTFNKATNTYFGNSINGMANGFSFPKYARGLPLVTADAVTYTPVINGRLTAGTATYAVQQGVYSVVGNVCTFHAAVQFSSHTGTGQMLMSLPITPGSSRNLENIPVCAKVWGVTTTTIPAGAAVAAETSKTMNQIWFLTESGGTEAQLVVPASGLVHISGSYFVD